ncbi:transposase family protein [Streptosporangium sp. NPDC049376]|uniref:transposase family protein n=1 Tax=Streptosporangium sp. NPDC049376 TaxID=3366192 RepID=UPI00378D015D
MLFYRAVLSLSHQTLSYLSGLIHHRHTIGSLWRRLGPGRQAPLVLVHLRKGETLAEVAAGFGVGVSTAWRYIREAITLADEGYTGAGEHVRVPYKGRNKSASQKGANSAHARLRGPGERANAQLKAWRILRRLRCCPLRAGQLVKAILTLQLREVG